MRGRLLHKHWGPVYLWDSCAIFHSGKNWITLYRMLTSSCNIVHENRPKSHKGFSANWICWEGPVWFCLLYPPCKTMRSCSWWNDIKHFREDLSTICLSSLSVTLHTMLGVTTTKFYFFVEKIVFAINVLADRVPLKLAWTRQVIVSFVVICLVLV